MKITADQYLIVVDNEDGTCTQHVRFRDDVEVSVVVPLSIFKLIEGLMTPEVMKNGTQFIEENGGVTVIPNAMPEED